MRNERYGKNDKYEKHTHARTLLLQGKPKINQREIIYQKVELSY